MHAEGLQWTASTLMLIALAAFLYSADKKVIYSQTVKLTDLPERYTNITVNANAGEKNNRLCRSNLVIDYKTLILQTSRRRKRMYSLYDLERCHSAHACALQHFLSSSTVRRQQPFTTESAIAVLRQVESSRN